MAPQIDPSDFLLSIGKKYRDLSPAQQNEYQRLDKAKRRSEQFRAIAEAGETGSGQSFQEYLRQDRKEKEQEKELRIEQDKLERQKKKLRSKYERKGVTVATTEKEIRDYFEDLSDRQLARLNNPDRQERTIQNRIESREVEIKSKIADAQDDIKDYVDRFDGGNLYKREYAKLTKNNQDFLRKSGLIGNNMIKLWLYQRKDKDPNKDIESWQKFIFNTPNLDRQALLVRNASENKLREIITKKFLPNTPFHAENQVPDDMKEQYQGIIDRANAKIEADMLGQFKKNYPDYVRDFQKRLVEGEKERIEDMKESNIQRAINQLKVAQREAQEKGREYKWIKKYVKLVFDLGDTIDNIEKKQDEGYIIPVKIETTLKDVLTNSRKLIDDITDIEDTISAIDRKKEKTKEDYEEAVKKLKDKKKKATLLKKRKSDLDKFDAERVIELQKQRKEAIQLAKIQKRYSKAADELKKEINKQAGKSEDKIDKILSNIDKQINKAQEGAEGNLEIKISPAPPIPFNVKGKKPSAQELKQLQEALMNESLGIDPTKGISGMTEGKKKRKNKKSEAKQQAEIDALKQNLKLVEEARKKEKEKKKAQRKAKKEKSGKKLLEEKEKEAIKKKKEAEKKSKKDKKGKK